MAVPQSNIVLKDIIGGRSRVNTHTGTVRVAASQGNTVCRDMSVSVNLIREKQMSSGMQDELSCDNSVRSAKPECGEKCEAKNPYNISVKHCKGHLLEEQVQKHKVADQSLRPKHISTSSINSTSRLRDYFHNLSKSIPGGNVARGAPSTVTPTKRKLIQNKKVALLVPVFDLEHMTVISPTESESSESPAKRQKLGSGVKHPSSQPPKSADFR